ncbi:testicular acid phosphatase homolog [Diabrotica undecimpunctata]|uniref:testicular acid phosphatase homolog n=1 Tax=Diabrotica undecimpunctata TaxID=50387 RepID=UPI003B63E8B1
MLILKKIVILFYIFLTVTSEENVTIDCSNLVALVQIIRHGERTPTNFYKNDPYKNESYWDAPTGELTHQGMREAEEIGQFTKRRYANFFPKKYDNNFVYALTTNVDRAHMSGQCFLYGLYPAADKDIWKEGLNWQPIPLHQANPRIFHNHPYNCPMYITALGTVYSRNPKVYDPLFKKYKAVFEYMSEKTGDPIDNFLKVLTLHDSLFVEEKYGYKLQDWTKEIYPEPMRTMAAIGYKSLTEDIQLKQFYCGTLLTDIVRYLHRAATKKSHTPKYRFYSGHDTILVALLNSLGAFDPPIKPEFSSSLYVELRRKTTKGHFVNVYFKNGNKITAIKVKNCKNNCPLRQFKAALQDVMIDVKRLREMCGYLSQAEFQATLHKLFSNDPAPT